MICVIIAPDKEGDIMNKYVKELIIQEIRSNRQENRYRNKIMENIKQRMYELYPSVSEIITIDNEDLFTILIHRLNCFDENVISIVLDELQKSNHCKNSTLWSLLRNFNTAVLDDDQETMQNIVESAKILGIIQNIALEKDCNYKLITTNNDNISFSYAWKTYKGAVDAIGQCHGFTRECLIERGNAPKCVAVVSKIPTHFNHSTYHSYIIYNEKVYDLAMNLTMKQGDYYKLFSPTPIASFTQEEFNTTLEQLRSEDEDFESANIDDLLKCAMAKQMKKEKRYHP